MSFRRFSLISDVKTEALGSSNCFTRWLKQMQQDYFHPHSMITVLHCSLVLFIKCPIYECISVSDKPFLSCSYIKPLFLLVWKHVNFICVLRCAWRIHLHKLNYKLLLQKNGLLILRVHPPTPTPTPDFFSPKDKQRPLTLKLTQIGI